MESMNYPLHLLDILAAAEDEERHGVKPKFVDIDVIRTQTTVEAMKLNLRSVGFSEQLSNDLIRRIHDRHHPAKLIYLILFRIEQEDRLNDLIGTPFCDADLPVSFDGSDFLVRNGSPGPTQFFNSSWKRIQKESFRDRQAAFLAPVLDGQRFDFDLTPDIPLPLVEKKRIKRTGFSQVYRVKIHPSHCRNIQSHSRSSSYALKLVDCHTDQVMSVPQAREKKMLGLLYRLEHNHLIKPIATFSSSSEMSFLFPWADIGSLNDFWKANSEPALGKPETVAWMLRQMRGMCGALVTLAREGIRHSDLKPENLLCFNGDEVTIKITDVGISQHHVENTTQRLPGTEAKHTSFKYAAPEFSELNSTAQLFIPYPNQDEAKLSRRFDIWSLGCVFIEFLIWYGKGHKELNTFDDQLRKVSANGEFWRKNGGRVVLNDEVLVRLPELRRLDFPCGVLDLIENDMLITDWTRRSTAEAVLAKLEKICQDRHVDELSGFSLTSHNAIVSTGHSTPRTLPRRPRSPIKQLARSESLNQSLNNAGFASFGNGMPSLQFPPESPETGDTSARKPLDTAAAANYNDRQTAADEEQQRIRLHDRWILAPDNQAALSLFTASDFIKENVQLPLCITCSKWQIWKPNFELSGRIAEYGERSSRCSLCRLIYDAAKHLGLEGNDMVFGSWEKVTFCVTGNGRSVGLPIFLEPQNVTAQGRIPDITGLISNSSQTAQLGNPGLLRPGSSHHYELLRKWLHTCDEEHDHWKAWSRSPEDKTMPTRLINVGGPVLKLQNHNGCPYSRYAALSHCWGSGSPFQLLDENIEALHEQIHFHDLPRTFQDAIRVTRGLGLSFLWIDSLCIIQENAKDWEYEAVLMHQVYSNAYCTIAASSAASSDIGFLDRPRRQPLFAPVPGPGNTQLYISECIENFDRDVQDAPLNRRGWVFQERALSRRMLHFTDTQVYWECGKGVQSERLLRLTNPQATLLSDSNFPESILPFYKDSRTLLFQSLYKQYSRLAFTHVKDRPVAISGLETRLMRTFKTRGGFGIFETYLQRSLLWKRQGGTYLDHITFSGEQKVPSWSWMAYSGPIDYMSVPFAEVEWCLTSSAIFARGEGAEVFMRSTITAMSRGLRLKDEDVIDRIWFDVQGGGLSQGLRCIVVGKDKVPNKHGDRAYYVLLISKNSEQDDRYVRVGVGWVLEGHILPPEEQVVVH